SQHPVIRAGKNARGEYAVHERERRSLSAWCGRQCSFRRASTPPFKVELASPHRAFTRALQILASLAELGCPRRKLPPRLPAISIPDTRIIHGRIGWWSADTSFGWATTATTAIQRARRGWTNRPQKISRRPARIRRCATSKRWSTTSSGPVAYRK